MSKEIDLRSAPAAKWVEALSKFPPDWPVVIDTRAGGHLVAKHRQTRDGKDMVAIYGDNGGKFGHEPFTDEEYYRAASSLISALKLGHRYTENGGEPYVHPVGFEQSHCYGTYYDKRVIARMVAEGNLNVGMESFGPFGEFLTAKVLKPLEMPAEQQTP